MKALIKIRDRRFHKGTRIEFVDFETYDELLEMFMKFKNAYYLNVENKFFTNRENSITFLKEMCHK